MTNLRTQLLIIDPQNDFMDIEGAALPVQGANADMNRLAAFIDGARDKLDDIHVTLDSHHRVGIERPAMWRKADGSAVNRSRRSARRRSAPAPMSRAGRKSCRACWRTSMRWRPAGAIA